VPRNADQRLIRLAADDGYESARAYGRRHSRFILAICGEIRAAALAAGIEPATVPIEKVEWWAKHDLNLLGETPEVQRQDAARAEAENEEWAARHPGGPHPRDKLIADLDERSRRYLDGSRLGPDAPLWEWYAWARIQPVAVPA
jgi:hypothetical protein